MKRVGLIHFNHRMIGNLVGWQDLRGNSWVPNYGDMLVCSALLQQTAGANTIATTFGGFLSGKVDYAVLRGSTYLFENWDYEAAIKTLDSIDAPVICVGLGAQHPTADPKFLDGNQLARTFVQKLAEKSKSISARGEFTAEILKRLGAKDVRVTGCPSMFYGRRVPRVEVPDLLLTKYRRLGVSIHSGLSANIYCRAPADALALHGKVIAYAIENGTNCSVFEQGVLAEYDVCDATLPFSERLTAATVIIKRIEADATLTPHDLVARMVSVKTIEEWIAKARDVDAMLGFRFHGNMVAIHQGIPALYYTYDSRIEEFVKLYKLPSQDVSATWVDPIKTIADHDWSNTNKAINACFAELLAFYKENGVTTSLAVT